MLKSTYSKTSYRLIGFELSAQYGKKYDAILVSVKTGKQIRLSFGQRDSFHYKDVTGLGMFSDFNNLDEDRRAHYRQKNIGKIANKQYSEDYFNLNYLW